MDTLFEHHHIDHQAPRTIFLLHGTGGGIEDFLFLDQVLRQQYNLVALQGNINEHGMARFFQRHGHGQFDQDSIREETSKLNTFIADWQQKYNISPANTFGLGYSNGANILLSLLAQYPGSIKTHILLHPMLPFRFDNLNLDLSGHRAFVSSSQNDPIITPDPSREVIEALQPTGIQLQHHDYDSGHQISDQEIGDVLEYLVQR